MVTITLDPNHGYVFLAAFSTFVMNTAHMISVGQYRKAAKVAYPAAYAPESRTDEAANRFNCAQRAHAHFIENQASMLGALALAGVQYPLTAAGLGLGWTLSRYLYMTGYSKGGDGKGRYNGGTWFLFQAGLYGLAGYNGLALIMGW